jgi:acetyltransferase-like isoleucine patch superfamily enzyme
MRGLLKSLAFALATIFVLPSLLFYRLRAAIVGADRALLASSQAYSLVPGIIGQYLRRAFYSRTMADFHPSATIEFGTIFSRVDSSIGENVYIGPMCHIGLVKIERNVLLAAGVHVPSGPATHGIQDLSRPIRDQPGELRRVRVGEGSWLGSAAVVLADIGRDTVVASGAVVTKPMPDRAIVGGVPAEVLRSREPAAQ